MMADDRITDLRDRPEFTAEVVDQNVATWGGMVSIDRDEMAALFATDTPRGQLPEHLIALVDDRYAGCVSLRTTTLGAVKHADWYLSGVGPWLSNMWVDPAARGRGLAKRLTAAVESRAIALGVQTLYSSTAEPDSLYHQLGFRTTSKRVVDRGDGQHLTIYMIRKDLAA